MYSRYIILIHCVLFIVSITGHELKLWNDKTCSSTYTVYTSEGKQIDMKIQDISALDCKKFIGDSRRYKEISDIRPFIMSDFKNGIYVANITWEYTAKGKKLPKQFVLNMTFYESYLDTDGTTRYRYSNDTCVMLILTSGRRLSHTDSKMVTFYFDCLPLQGPEHSGLKVEVLIYPHKYPRKCRSMRSIPEGGSRKCGNKGVECSQPINFGVTLDAHTYRQCACHVQNYGEPTLSWQRDLSTNSFKITINNLPPYLKTPVEIDVFSADNDDRYQFIEKASDINNNPHFYTATPKDGEDIQIYVRVNATIYAECQRPGKFESHYEEDINTECNSDGSIYIKYYEEFENVPKQVASTDDEDTVNYLHIILILAVVFVIASTVVVFYIKMYRHRNNCNILHSSRTSSCYMTCTKFVSICTNRSNDATTTGSIANQNEYQLRELHPLSDNNQPHTSSTVETSLITSPVSIKQNQVLLMYTSAQNDTQLEQEIVPQLVQTLKNKCSLTIDTVHLGQNSESRVDINSCSHYSHIILLITPDLHTLCTSTSAVVRTGVVKQDHTCAIVKTVNKYKHPEGQTSFHVISFGYQENLSEFLTNHRFNAEPNCIPYYFTSNSVDHSENGYVLNQLRQNIGNHGYEDSRSAIDNSEENNEQGHCHDDGIQDQNKCFEAMVMLNQNN